MKNGIFLFLTLFALNLYSQVPEFVPTDNLKAWYNFDGHLNDLSGNNGSGSIYETVPFTVDRSGNSNSALQLGNGVVQLPSSVFTYTRSETFSVSMWFTNSHPQTVNRRLISTECAEGNLRITDNWEYVSVMFGDYVYVNIKNPEVWNHLVYTYDANTEKIYLNGNLVTTNYDDEKVEIRDFCNPFTIGGKASLPDNDRWTGNFDDLGVWSRVLNPNEVRYLYQGKQNGPSQGLSIGIKDSSFVETNFISATVYTDSLAIQDSVSAYQFNVLIPPGLTFNSFDTSGTLSINGLIEYNQSSDTLVFAYSGQEFLTGNNRDLINLKFDVSTADDYTVQLKDIYFNATNIDSTVQGFISYSPLLGDVDNNLSIQAYDASLVLMNSVGKNGLSSDPLPWKNWRKTSADVNKDGKILADDASQILQRSIGLIEAFEKVKTKKTDPIIEVEVKEDTLIFTSLNNQLLGANINIETGNDIELFDPIYTKSGMLTAESRTEEFIRIGIASSEEIEGTFLKLPYISEANQDLNMELYSNSKQSFKTVGIKRTTTSGELDSETPSRFILKQNYPNPFNPSTTISFTIPYSTFATVEVFNVAGAKIFTLIDTYLNAGHHSIRFDGSNLSTGVYFYKLKTTEFEQVKNMILIK